VKVVMERVIGNDRGAIKLAVPISAMEDVNSVPEAVVAGRFSNGEALKVT
jgi:hypothetical protein